MDSIKYKGYTASVHYSDEDKVLFGKVHVDDYLKTCKKFGKSQGKLSMDS